jgi:tripartite-type tricarboxylate transporter receptor subunit TctC
MNKMSFDFFVPQRRTALISTLGFAISPLSAIAQEWPAKSLTFVVPFPAGGSNDIAARMVAEGVRKRLGQSVVIDNKAGANGALGVESVLRAPKDQHTFLIASDSVSLLPLFRTTTWDLTKTFTPVAALSFQPIVVVTSPSTGIKSIKDLQALAKTKPNQVPYASSGQGSIQHLVGELFSQQLGIDLLHVPYKGGGQALTDVLGGQIPLVYTAIAGAHQHVKSGKLKAIGVSSSLRSPALPDVPTFTEGGGAGLSDFVVNSWVGLFAPVGTPAPVITRLTAELSATLADPVVKDKLRQLGIESAPTSSAAFDVEIKRDLVRYGAVVKAANIKAE